MVARHGLRLGWVVPVAAAAVAAAGWLGKPRLPRNLAPSIVGANGKATVYLAYDEGGIQHRVEPFVPESVSFSIIPRDPADYAAFPFASLFGLRRVGLVATGSHGGQRGFRLDEATLDEMRRLEEHPGDYPEPHFSIDAGASWGDGRRSSLNVGSLISFTGRDPSGGDTTYVLRFG